MMKTIQFVAICCAFALMTTTAVVRADYLNANGDLETLKISPSDTWDNRSLASLFNSYFADQLDGFAYSNSNDLFNDRGVKYDVQNWTVSEGARMESSFKNAGYGHTLNLLNASGETIDSTNFASWTFSDNLGGDHVFNLAAGDYNFSLETWSTAQGTSSSDPTKTLETFYGSDPSMNSDNMYHMVAFDVTDLVRLMYGDESITSAYMFGWEDLTNGDWDYQDLAYIMVNVAPNATPEPATALIFGLGALVLPFAGKRLRGKKQS